MIRFESLQESHFPTLTEWFNKPHVQVFYSLRNWTLEEVKIKYTPYVRKEKPVNCFIAYLKEKPFGFIQDYAVKDYGWLGQDFREGTAPKSPGIDLPIGEETILTSAGID